MEREGNAEERSAPGISLKTRSLGRTTVAPISRVYPVVVVVVVVIIVWGIFAQVSWSTTTSSDPYLARYTRRRRNCTASLSLSLSLGLSLPRVATFSYVLMRSWDTDAPSAKYFLIMHFYSCFYFTTNNFLVNVIKFFKFFFI